MELKAAIKDGIDDLKATTREGFDSLLMELRMSREQGHIPVSVMEKMLTAQNEAFKENRKSSDEAYSKILKTFAMLISALMAWFTGVYAFTDKPEIAKPEGPQGNIQIIEAPIKDKKP